MPLVILLRTRSLRQHSPGDLHGQYFDLARIFEMNGYPAHNNRCDPQHLLGSLLWHSYKCITSMTLLTLARRRYIFNGDFVDRGAFGVEVVLTLFAWKASTSIRMQGGGKTGVLGPENPAAACVGYFCIAVFGLSVFCILCES